MNSFAADSALARMQREVIADPHARYFGTELSERSLVPGDDAQLGETRFEDWLNRLNKPSFCRRGEIGFIGT